MKLYLDTPGHNEYDVYFVGKKPESDEITVACGLNEIELTATEIQMVGIIIGQASSRLRAKVTDKQKLKIELNDLTVPLHKKS